MPVPARLSKRAHDAFGEEIANEIVEWLNQLDASSRDELYRLNELNYARFEAKLEQRIAELRAEIIERLAKFREELEASFGKRFEAIDRRFEAIDKKFDAIEKRFDQQNRMMFLGWVTLVAAMIAIR